jgi:hypothetical protein
LRRLEATVGALVEKVETMPPFSATSHAST